MFGNNAFKAGSTFSLSKILGGISKSLNVANQAIPLYQQAKPMINSARSAFAVVKGFANGTKTTKNPVPKKNVQPVNNAKPVIKEKSTNNNPIFFQ